jgi:hypothetical protein
MMRKKPDPAIIALLKSAGHSTFKALKIAHAFARGDRHARTWVWALQLKVSK